MALARPCGAWHTRAVLQHGGTEMARAIKWFLVFLSVWAGLAQGGNNPQTDQAATKAVIEGQLDAFAHHDADKAYSYASDDIKAMFQNPITFATMVERNYSVVYHPASVRFLAFSLQGDVARHTLQMVDQDQTLWTVYYVLTRNEKGQWKISSCQIEKVQGELI